MYLEYGCVTGKILKLCQRWKIYMYTEYLFEESPRSAKFSDCKVYKKKTMQEVKMDIDTG